MSIFNRLCVISLSPSFDEVNDGTGVWFSICAPEIERASATTEALFPTISQCGKLAKSYPFIWPQPIAKPIDVSGRVSYRATIVMSTFGNGMVKCGNVPRSTLSPTSLHLAGKCRNSSVFDHLDIFVYVPYVWVYSVSANHRLCVTL